MYPCAVWRLWATKNFSSSFMLPSEMVCEISSHPLPGSRCCCRPSRPCLCVVLRGFYSLQATGTALIGQNITKILQNISHPISCLQIYNSWLYGDRSIHNLRTWSLKPKINFLLKFSSLNLNWIFFTQEEMSKMTIVMSVSVSGRCRAECPC